MVVKIHSLSWMLLALTLCCEHLLPMHQCGLGRKWVELSIHLVRAELVEGNGYEIGKLQRGPLLFQI